MESFPFSQVWLAEDIIIEFPMFSQNGQNAGADAQLGRPAMSSRKACVAENDLPLPLAFSGLRCPEGWDWGVGFVGLPKWQEDGCETTFFGTKIQSQFFGNVIVVVKSMICHRFQMMKIHNYHNY